MKVIKTEQRHEESHFRTEHNRDLIRRMRNGEPLTSFDSHASWFPPRPTIEKNQEALVQLYGTAEKEGRETPSTKALKLIKD